MKSHIISESATLIKALDRLNTLPGGSMTLFAVDESGKLTGSLTDGDIRRGLDYWIAAYNIAACSDGKECDRNYLANRLSLDAVPALPEEVYNDGARRNYWRRAQKYQKQREAFLGIRAYNFSRAYAAPKIKNPDRGGR